MTAHKIFALIFENIVKNTIICENYHIADSLAKTIIDADAFAVDITMIPVSIGDSHVDNVFKDSNGMVINALPTSLERINEIHSENEALKASQESQDELIMSLMLGGA